MKLLSTLGILGEGRVHCYFERYLFHDIDQFAEQLSTQRIEPIQLSLGKLKLRSTSIRFEDVVITRLDCNRRVSDRLSMDPSWLLVVVLLTPQRWGALIAPAESIFVVAPGTEYRNSVPEGFRCVEAAIRLDLAEQVGLDYLCQLKGAEAVMPISAAAAQSAERWVDRFFRASATSGSIELSGETVESLRAGCLDFLRFLHRTVFSATRGQADSARVAASNRFALAEKAMKAIEAMPLEVPLSVETLATALGITRRTLLKAFQVTLDTSPSRYILARRLGKAHKLLCSGECHTVTDAAFDCGFNHLGRFAINYSAHFGETPSTTIRRARVLQTEPKADVSVVRMTETSELDL